jgi:hypothetical protein
VSDEANVFLTKDEMREIINKLRGWGTGIEYKEEPEDPESVLDDTSWFDDPEMGNRS